MNTRKTIQKIFVITAWLIVASGITTLLIAANRKEQKHICRKLVINIKSSTEDIVIDKNNIAVLLHANAKHKLTNQPLSNINLQRLEKVLENNPWIANAELYFDSRDILHVTVTEKQPVARVFTSGGASYYIDSSAVHMPLMENVSLRLPVVTNFPDIKVLRKTDSALIKDIKSVLQFIRQNSFWNAQIAQIDITADRMFELIPTVGNHIIKIGGAENLDQKLERLYIFYQQVMSKTGFSKYRVLDVQYEGQVVATRKSATAVADSIQLQEKISELLNKIKLDEEKLKQEFPEQTVTNTSEKIKPVATDFSVLKKTNPHSNPVPEKSKRTSNSVEKNTKMKKVEIKRAEVKKAERKPKAVMTKPNDY
ncbi:MAG: FtsQ-type POTRA domain-containing protein [Chitinophagaceae bacterium]|nr:FtsQ-type POTRA domain-containing protein [Chitinophagaceae bacterium]